MVLHTGPSLSPSAYTSKHRILSLKLRISIFHGIYGVRSATQLLLLLRCGNIAHQLSYAGLA